MTGNESEFEKSSIKERDGHIQDKIKKKTSKKGRSPKTRTSMQKPMNYIA